ncbi:hypothetical protein ACFQX6_08990 [Streptosporangium lutulentum]
MSRTVAVIGEDYGGSTVARAPDAEAGVILIDPQDAFVNSTGSPRAVRHARRRHAAKLDEPFPPPAPNGAGPAPEAYAR